jgi:hypothetical protein
MLTAGERDNHGRLANHGIIWVSVPEGGVRVVQAVRKSSVRLRMICGLYKAEGKSILMNLIPHGLYENHDPEATQLFL